MLLMGVDVSGNKHMVLWYCTMNYIAFSSQEKSGTKLKWKKIWMSGCLVPSRKINIKACSKFHKISNLLLIRIFLLRLKLIKNSIHGKPRKDKLYKSMLFISDNF